MPDISLWVGQAERSLRRLRSGRVVLSFAVVHEGDEPKLAIRVPFPTDESAPGYNAARFRDVHRQIRSALPDSIPFRIVGPVPAQDGRP